MGQVCLQNTMAFGVVAGIITWWVYPLMERWIARVPRDIMNIAFVVIAVFGAIVWSLYLINPPGVDDANLPENKDKPEVVQKEYESRMVASKLAEIDTSIDQLERAIDASEVLDKEKLKAEAEQLRADAKKMLNEGLEMKEYPDVYQQLLGQLGAPKS